MDRQLLIVTDTGVRAATGCETGHTFLVAPSSDGEFHAACSCGWVSFGSYASPRHGTLFAMHADHTRTADPDAWKIPDA